MGVHHWRSTLNGVDVFKQCERTEDWKILKWVLNSLVQERKT